MIASLPIKFLFCFLILLNISLPSHSQSTTRIFSAKDFLGNDASRAIPYDIALDTNGYIYFTGPRGFQRFNGRELKSKWDVQKEIHGQFFPFLFKDYKERLWMTNQLGICYIEGDSIIKYELPDTVHSIGFSGIDRVYRDSKKNIHLSLAHKGYIKIDSLGSIIKLVDNSSDINGFVVKQLEDGKWFHYSIKKRNNTNTSVYFEDFQGEFHQIISSPYLDPIHQSSLVEHKDGSLSISTGNRAIVRFKGKKLIHHHIFDHKVIKLFVDKENYLWIGSLDAGLFKALNSDLTKFEKYWNGATAACAQDLDGGLWIKSDLNGFGYIPPIASPHFSAQNGFGVIESVLSLQAGNNKVFFLNKQNELYLLENDSLTQLFYPPVPLVPEFQKIHIKANQLIYNSEKDVLWVKCGKLLFKWHEDTWTTFELSADFEREYLKLIKLNHDGSIIGCTKNRIFIIENDSIKPISESSGRSIMDFTIDGNNKIWVTKYDGLWVLENGKFVRPFETLPEPFLEPIRHIFYAQNTVWFNLLGEEFYWIQNDSLVPLKDKNGDYLHISDYTITPAGKIWKYSYPTRKISEISNNQGKLEIHEYFINKIAADQFNYGGLWATNEKLYISSYLGLFEERFKNLPKTQPGIRIAINEIRINLQKVAYSSTYDLNYNENSINIIYDAISFRDQEITYSYILVGHDTSWQESPYRQVQYTNLDPGEYKFNIRSKIDSGEWGETHQINFIIAKPFWATWWFRLTALLGLSLIVYTIFKIRVHQVRKKEQEKSDIALEFAHLELKALKAQINPHFIFNSITSVMYYLSKNKNEEAETYLQRFSKLIRKVLESSDKQLVPIQEEIELMKHYIRLESERFKGEKIEFLTKYNGVDPQHFKIPPTLLQPYIENAIRHGLKPKEGSREITVVFLKTSLGIKVTITDNGIGRKRAAQNDTRDSHKSMGMLISSRRIEVLNNKQINKVEIKDLMNKDEIGVGTQVTFHIPESTESMIA